jgi:N-acetylglucosaminyl-diphospho-decaprenol L-rhamnosyltransferase
VSARPDVTVIVIAHDVRDEVLACLESVERHAGPVTAAVVFVDNASGDGTAEAVAAAFPATEIVRLERNEGLAARNHGLRRATGRLRMFLDSDALLTPGALPELAAFLDEHPGVGLVGPRLVYPDGTLQLSARRFPPLALPLMRRPPLARFFERSRWVRDHVMADDPHDRTRDVEYVLGACQLFTERAQAAAVEVDPRMFFGPDDADWCFSIRRAGMRIVYHPGATVVHAYRRSSAQRPFSRVALEQLRAFARFQWKWRRERGRLRAEGRAMDARARAASGRETALQ